MPLWGGLQRTDSCPDMTTAVIQQLEEAHQIPTYHKWPLALVRGQGSHVWDADGHRYLDFYGGHCVTPLGHCPPGVVKAIQSQCNALLFYSNVVYSDVRARAAALLAELAPLKHIYFCNSGTEANETALKVARKHTGRSGVIATKGGFHGRTLGSLSTTWNPRYREPYQDVLATTHFVPFGNLDSVASCLTQNTDIAAFILEPIQSIGGLAPVPDSYFHGLRDLCDRHEVLLIFDEIQTGVGRTGTFSISEQIGVEPDMITLAKSLGSGVPVGAVLMSEALREQMQLGDQGSTFGGGMVAMAAVESVLTELKVHPHMRRAMQVHVEIAELMSPHGFEMRGRGCLIGARHDEPVSPMVSALRGHRVLVGGSGDPHVMRLMPPLNTSDEDLAEFGEALDTAMHDVAG